MNKELREKWIKALESGKYKQNTDGFFRNTKEEYGLFGILLDCYDNTKWTLLTIPGDPVGNFYRYDNFLWDFNRFTLLVGIINMKEYTVYLKLRDDNVPFSICAIIIRELHK